MSKVFRNSTMKDEYRTLKFNGIGDFEHCEFCHCSIEETKAINIKYYDRYKKILCDRCVDNHDGVTVWNDEHAKKYGLPNYPGIFKKSTFWDDVESFFGERLTFY